MYDTATIRFTVPGVQDGATIVVWHQKDNGEWEQLTVEGVSANMVIATSASWSPVAFVAEGTSPNTGATSVLPIIAVICIAGLAFCGYRMKRLA